MGRRKKSVNEIEVSAEDQIQQKTIEKYLAKNPDWILYQKEYDVIPLMKGFGKGDLVFQMTDNYERHHFHVIECKNHSISETITQAEYYASWIKLLHPKSRVTFQAVVIDTWSIVYDMDMNKAIYNTLTKIHSLVGLSKNELMTLSQLYTNLIANK
jgi:hypothetical protein